MTEIEHQTAQFKAEIDRLSQKVENLHSLFDISGIINSTLDLNEVLELSMHLAKKVMRAEAASVMLLSDDKSELIFQIALGEVGTQLQTLKIPATKGIAGSVVTSKEAIVINDAQNDPRFFQGADKKTGFVTRSIMCAPLITKGDLIGVTQVLNRTGSDPFRDEDLILFKTFSNQVATAIENSRLHTSLLEKQKLEQELETAAVIQKGFLPQVFPENRHLKIVATHVSAKQCSGDFYDIIEFENNQIGILIGDVAGKGVPAALHMAGFISDFRSLAPVKRDSKELFNALNGMLYKKMIRGKFITLTYVLIDCSTFFVELLNAGHIPSILVRPAQGLIQRVDAKGGPPLGIMEGLSYECENTRFESGDIFLMFTDGLTEGRNLAGEMFEYDNLEKIIRENMEKPLPELFDLILKGVETFCKGTVPHDDLTMVGFELKEL